MLDIPRCSMVLEYLPTFTPKLAQMKVNIPYIEHLGYGMYRDHSDTWILIWIRAIHGSTRIGAGMDYGWTLLPEYILGRRVAEKPHE
jgi:hypothetical protein